MCKAGSYGLILLSTLVISGVSHVMLIDGPLHHVILSWYARINDTKESSVVVVVVLLTRPYIAVAGTSFVTR